MRAFEVRSGEIRMPCRITKEDVEDTRMKRTRYVLCYPENETDECTCAYGPPAKDMQRDWGAIAVSPMIGDE